MSEVKQISALRVVVDRDALCKLLSYREGTTRIDSRVEKLVDDTIREGYSLLETSGVYRDVKLSVDDGAGVYIDGAGFTLGGRSIVKHLAGCSRGTIMAVTIGGAITMRVKELLEAGEMARASILDAFGSEAVESLADIVTAHISSAAGKMDCSLTERFSPGYGDLSLEHQRKLFEYVEAYWIGISLTETLTMIPEKTITAILGWREKR